MAEFYKAKEIILEDRVVSDAYLMVSDGRFQALLKALPEGARAVDLGSDAVIGPGYVDTHIHGFVGADVMDGKSEALLKMARALPSAGVTSWLPTTLTASEQALLAACRAAAQARKVQEEGQAGSPEQDEAGSQTSGAKIQGLFFEGPFFTEDYKGAQNPKYMSNPDLGRLEGWLEASDGLLNKIALAPERQGTLDFIRGARALGVTVSLGHSNATFDQAKAAVGAGASMFNHVYNAMSKLHHRTPNMVGAALSLPDVYGEIIADGQHVHPAAIAVFLKARQPNEVVLVTDCMRAGGLGEGESKLGEFDVIVKDGAARLKEGGSLAGSILELKDAVKNLVSWGLTDLPTAVRMASQNPARSVGIADRCGVIRPGRAADFLVLSPSGEFKSTYIKGRKVYQA